MSQNGLLQILTHLKKTFCPLEEEHIVLCKGRQGGWGGDLQYVTVKLDVFITSELQTPAAEGTMYHPCCFCGAFIATLRSAILFQMFSSHRRSRRLSLRCDVWACTNIRNCRSLCWCTGKYIPVQQSHPDATRAPLVWRSRDWWLMKGTQTLMGWTGNTTLIYMCLIYRPIWFRGLDLHHRLTQWKLHVGDNCPRKSNKRRDYTQRFMMLPCYAHTHSSNLSNNSYTSNADFLCSSFLHAWQSFTGSPGRTILGHVWLMQRVCLFYKHRCLDRRVQSQLRRWWEAVRYCKLLYCVLLEHLQSIQPVTVKYPQAEKEPASLFAYDSRADCMVVNPSVYFNSCEIVHNISIYAELAIDRVTDT